MTCAWFCSDSLLKSSVRTNRCSQTWTKHGQHEVEAVALQQGTVDGKSPRLQHPGTLLSGRCRLEARLTRAEGDGGGFADISGERTGKDGKARVLCSEVREAPIKLIH